MGRDQVPERHLVDLGIRNGHKKESKGLPGRVDLGEILENGIEPVPQLIEGLLYEGRIHSLAGEPGSGKTFISLWSCLEVMKQGQPVLYLDAENGPRLITERLRDMGATREDLELFAYYNAEVALDDNEGVAMLQATLEELEPALVVLDSFADLLSISGLEENSNDDCTLWMRRVAQGIKDAGSAVLILDHVPKGGKGPRGGGSKKAKVDVQWDLGVEQPFDRERTGEIELKNDKDRECWLPKIVRFSVGGGVFAMSAGTIEIPNPQTNMTGSASTVYDALKRAGAEGARWKDLERAAGGSKGTVQRGLKELERYQLTHRWNGRYYLTEMVPESPIDTPDSESTARYQKGTTVQGGTGESGKVPGGTTPLRGGTPVPDAPTDDVGDLREMFGEDQ